MQSDEIRQSDDRSLAQLLDLISQSDAPWSGRELGAVWQHQLSTSLQFDLGAAGDESLRENVARYSQTDPPICTFGELFFHPQPPVELLELVKEFAKTSRSRPDGPLPDEITTVLYALSIAAAMTKCDRRISGLDNAGLRHSFGWALGLNWLDDATKQMLRRGYDTLEPKD